MRRWLRRICLILVALVIATTIAAYVVLRSNLPRQWTIQIAKRKLGLEIEAASLRIGWSGHTTADKISIAAAPGEPTVISVHQIRIVHTRLLRLLVGDAFHLQSVVLHQPELRLVQRETGQWNLQQMLQELANKTGSQPIEPSDEGLPIDEVRLHETVVYIDRSAYLHPSPSPVESDKRSAAKGLQNNAGSSTADQAVDLPAIGPLSLVARFNGSNIQIDQVDGQMLGGHLDGQALVVVDEPLTSSVELRWNNFELAESARVWPQLVGLEGSVKGNLMVQPSTDEKALEPLAIKLESSITGGRFREVTFDEITINAWVGPERIVIDDLTMDLAKGKANLWFMLRQREDGLHGHIRTNLERINLDQIVRSIHAETKETPGIVSGSATVNGQIDAWQLMSGSADLELNGSDLANVPLMRTLYGAMRLETSASKPAGEGQVKLRLEGKRLLLESFAYFNRGIYVNGRANASDLSLGGDCPLQGLVAGAARPLKGLKLPGTDDIDKVLTAIQKDVACVEIGGSFSKLDYEVVHLADVGREFAKLLGSE